MNESRFLFVLDVIVLNLLDEGRRMYSLYRMCVLSLIILCYMSHLEQVFRKALTRMFTEDDDEDCVFMEICTRLKKSPHMVIECVPLPRELGDMAPIYFKGSLHYFISIVEVDKKKTRLCFYSTVSAFVSGDYWCLTTSI